MAQFLSPEWFDSMEAAAATYVPEDSSAGRASLRETVTDSPFGEVSWMLVIDEGKISFSRSADGEPDVNFRQDYATAAALHRGELTTLAAFSEGRIRVAGKLNTLLAQADLLTGIAPVFETVRRETTY